MEVASRREQYFESGWVDPHWKRKGEIAGREAVVAKIEGWLADSIRRKTEKWNRQDLDRERVVEQITPRLGKRDQKVEWGACLEGRVRKAKLASLKTIAYSGLARLKQQIWIREELIK